MVADSIQSVDAASVPYYDLLTAGFPCQPFTGTATGKLDDEGDGEWMEQRPRGFRDPRGQLFWHTIRLVRCHKADPQRQPKAILLENVPGLLKNDCTAPSGDTKDDDAAAEVRVSVVVVWWTCGAALLHAVEHRPQLSEATVSIAQGVRVC